MDFGELGARISPADEAAAGRARDKWNAVAKPIGSLGALEDAVVAIAALTGSEDVAVRPCAALVLCADNGVVAEGVSQSGPEVTTAVADNIGRNASSVCAMCRPVGIDVVGVDLGMVTPSTEAAVLDRHVARGTGNIAVEPAMTPEQAISAIEAGIDLVAQMKAKGYRMIATGEMGIGNTTTSTALACAFAGLSPDDVVGRGAGLSDAGLARKLLVVRQALDRAGARFDACAPASDAAETLRLLAQLGGFDIAGMAGVFLGGAIHRVPIVVDGVISTVAAYAASRLAPGSTAAMLASHVSTEPAAPLLLSRLGLEPVIHARMRLGEGTGAVCLVPLLDMALSLYNGTTFEATGIDAYEVDLH